MTTKRASKGTAGKRKRWIPYALRPMPDLEFFDDAADACVYFLIDTFQVAYVGATTCLPARVRQHRIAKKQFSYVLYFSCEAKEMRDLERAFIAHYQPELNKSGRRKFNGHDAHVLNRAGLKKFRARLDSIVETGA